MSLARKYGPPVSLGLSLFALIFAGLGRRPVVDQERLRELEADISVHASEAASFGRKLEGVGGGVAALEEVAGALEKRLSGARTGLRESYMRALRRMLTETVPRACDKAWNELMAALARTPGKLDHLRFKGEALRVLRLDAKKADEFARILVQERRERDNARKTFRSDRKKLGARIREIKRGVEERVQGLLSKEEFERYESWRKAGM